MYDQMFADINRHILVVWQSASVLVGGLAVFALAEKNVISIDIAASLVLLLTGWLLAHLQDASYWYNRNLVIIANIERQFLQASDLKKIHYYFGAHRPKNRMISHLRIQYALGIGLAIIMAIFHFSARVYPGLRAEGSTFDPVRSLPYAVALAVGVYLWRHDVRQVAAYAEFMRNSPGDTVDRSGIEYGVGHGYKKGENPV